MNRFDIIRMELWSKAYAARMMTMGVPQIQASPSLWADAAVREFDERFKAHASTRDSAGETGSKA